MDIVDRIFALVDQQYDEQQQFAAELDIPASRASEWRRRKSASYTKRLPQIADVLHTTVEYLLTGEQKEKPALPLESELDEELVTRLSSLTPEERKQVDAFVQGLLASR